MDIKDKNQKRDMLILFFIILLLLVSVITFLYSRVSNSNATSTEHSTKITSPDTSTQTPLASADEPHSVSHTSDNDNISEAIAYNIDSNNASTKYIGKRINIAVTGLDGRIGQNSQLADANHVISIFTETGEILITSIPRDTYCDLGFDDTTNLNKLTICHSKRGKSTYHKELSRIAEVNKIDYWIEFGFSQAMGIIEFLGFKDARNTLQVLRSRKGLGGDDYQRCYTQGQFIRQAILSHFSKFTGTLGGVLARAGLLLVETNITNDVALEIIDKLDKAGFPKSPDAVRVQVKPKFDIKYKIYDFYEEATVPQLVNKIEQFNTKRFKDEIETPQPKRDVQKILDDAIKSAAADSAKSPQRVISKLTPYFKQRAWYQVANISERERIRGEFGILLQNAYTKRNKQDEADKVKAVIEADKVLNDK